MLMGCREEGIRTLDTLLAYTHFPGVLLRPLGHLSKRGANIWEFIAINKGKGVEWGLLVGWGAVLNVAIIANLLSGKIGRV